jgi:hypothetical protein
LKPQISMPALVRRGLPVLALVVLSIGTTACGGSSSADDTATRDTVAPTSSTSTSTTSTTVPKQPCTLTNLQAAAAGQYPNVSVNDQACSAAFAVATLESSALRGGVGVGFFGVGADGAWSLIKVVGAGADLNAELPPGMPASLASGWQSRYNARVNQPASSGGLDDQGDFPTTTTTTAPPPPDTEPPVEEPPTEEAPAE